MHARSLEIGRAIREGAREVVPAAVICVTFAAMLVLSWGAWPDVLVDFGHELYAAWQLSEGRALGVDFRWAATGPLSPYLNALLFATFGAGLWVLVGFNLAILAAITALLFALTRELSDRLTATAATIAFLAIFAFGQYVEIGNYNYVTPYSHGVTHGIALSLASIWMLRRHARLGGAWRAVASGAGLGLVFLTKPEIFVACAAAVAVLGAASRREGRGGHGGLRLLLLVGAAAAAVPLLTILLLLTRMSLADALRVTVIPWEVLATPMTATPFYAFGIGLDQPAENLAALFRAAGGWAVVLGALALLDAVARPVALPRWVVAPVATVLALVSLTLWLDEEAWFNVARPLPLFVAGGGLAYGARLLSRATAPEVRSRAALGIALCAFAGCLLGKMLLNARVEHYGFALAMPAALLVVVWITWSAPGHLGRARGGGTVFRGAAVGLVLAAAVSFVRVADHQFSWKRFEVGVGPDRFRADERGVFVAAMLRHIEDRVGAAETLAVIPEGVMINYLSRRTNPAPYLTYLPDAIAAYGEERMLAAYRRSAPKFVLLVHRDATEHGAAFFGRDYARATRWWIDEGYEPVALVGAPPFRGEEYGMLLLERR